MATDTTLTHASVNSGTAVILPNVQVSWDWSNLTSATPATSKYDSVAVDKVGFENVKVTVSGAIDIDKIPTNGLTHALFVDFLALKSTDPIELKVSTGGVLSGVSETVLGGRPTAGYDSSGSNTLDTTNGISIVIDSASLQMSSSESKLGQRWNFSFIATETA
jgi:hypothetical protein